MSRLAIAEFNRAQRRLSRPTTLSASPAPDSPPPTPEGPRRAKWSVKSPYRGVYPTATGRWQVRLRVRGVAHHGGMHDFPEVAARAYDELATRLLGDRAILNFPQVSPATNGLAIQKESSYV